MKVWILQHESQAGDVKLIGVYGTEPEGRQALDRAGRLPGFREEPGGFSIDGYELGRDEWAEGYVSAPTTPEENRQPSRRDRAA